MVKTPASNAGGAGSIPGRGTKIPHAAWRSQKKKEKKSGNSLVVQTPCFHFQGCGFDPWLGELGSCKLRGADKNNNNNNTSLWNVDYIYKKHTQKKIEQWCRKRIKSFICLTSQGVCLWLPRSLICSHKSILNNTNSVSPLNPTLQ